MSGFDVKGALKEGYTRAQIVDHLAKQNGYDAGAARAEGYTDDAILRHLVGAPQVVEDKENPALFGMVGAGAGAAYGVGDTGIRVAHGSFTKRIEDAAEKSAKKLAETFADDMASRRAANPLVPGSGSGDAVTNWTKQMHSGAHHGGRDFSEAHEIASKLKAAEKADPRFRAVQGSPILLDTRTADQVNAARGAAPVVPPKAPPTRTPILQNPAVRIPFRAASLTGQLTTPAAGMASSGYGAAQAINRLQEGTSPRDKVAGAINVLGAASGLGSLAHNPKIKYPSTAISGALNWLSNLIATDKNEFAEPEQKAAGGAIQGYSRGKIVKGALDLIGKEPRAIQTVSDPLRMAYPGIYKRPDVIAAEAAARVAPESEALQRVFGVSRGDLYEMGKGRIGNLPGTLPGAAASPKGSKAAAAVMTPQNEQRLLDVMSEAEKHPALVQGMDPWYVMDPMYIRMEQLLGPEVAAAEYRKMNTLMGMASPGSEVLTEIPRGTAAYYLQKQGRFPEFVQHAGKSFPTRGADFPADILNVPGHAYHKTAQATPMQQFLETGEMQMSSPKVPMYIEASGVPQTGFQTATPVGDAHWSRAVGLADTRGAKTMKGKEVVPGASVSNPEMSMLAPWWRNQIAAPLGLESVPAQARAWGAFSPQTGVTSPIGAPKLELVAQKIMETASRLGVSPETARDMVLTGKTYAGKKEGGLATLEN